MLTRVSILGMIACQESTTSIDARCEIVTEVPTDTWTVGATETLQAFPMTSRIDTLVTINDVPISVFDIDKSACEDCDDCKTTAGCDDCNYCPDCVNQCDDCTHLLTVEIPTDLPIREEYWLSVHNTLGSSTPILVDIQEAN